MKPNTEKISVLGEAIITHSTTDVISVKAQMQEFYQKYLRSTKEELRNKDNLIISVLNKLSKQSD